MRCINNGSNKANNNNSQHQGSRCRTNHCLVPSSTLTPAISVHPLFPCHGASLNGDTGHPLYKPCDFLPHFILPSLNSDTNSNCDARCAAVLLLLPPFPRRCKPIQSYVYRSPNSKLPSRPSISVWNLFSSTSEDVEGN